VTKEEIIEAVKSMSVLELKDLVDALQEEFGVTAAVPMAVGPVGAPAAAGPVAEEKTEFSVVIKDIGEKKVQVIKTVREITNLGLKEAKDLVESAPNAVVVENVPQDEANTVKAKLEEAGATVEIR
jgi:large subunit ribosomal protein L7/L12